LRYLFTNKVVPYTQNRRGLGVKGASNKVFFFIVVDMVTLQVNIKIENWFIYNKQKRLSAPGRAYADNHLAKGLTQIPSNDADYW